MGPPEGKWIFLTQPDEIREMFTAPADVLHPGEGARVLEPIVGSRSVLLLDGREHLSQRKLMLPAFHGERMRALVGVMEEVAEREVDSSPGTYSWIPFGGGVRRCLGASFAQLEMRIALRAILSALEVTSALPGREGTGRRSITLSPRRGTPISVRPRVREPHPRRRLIRCARRANVARSAQVLSWPRRSGPRRLKAPQGPQPVPPPRPASGGAARLQSSSRDPLGSAPRRSRARPERLRFRQQDGDHAAAAEAHGHAHAARLPERKPAAERDVAVIRGWADALRHGRLERAVRYFAIPSVVSNGTSPIKLTSRDDVRFFNRTLPCGAKVLRVEDTGAYLVARFRLTERPGPGRCGAGVGGEASTAFLIRHRHIVQWRRVRRAGARGDAGRTDRVDASRRTRACGCGPAR